MPRNLRNLTLLIAAILMAGTTARAQDETYKFDLGGGIGMSGYLGDVNQSNMFRNPGFAAQLSFRYMFDTRWAVRGLFSTAGLRGNSEQWDNQFPDGQTYKFTSQIYELGARGEFNFLPYGIGETYKRLHRWTPYVGVGVGLVLASCKGNYVTMSVPLAFGVKYKVMPRLNLALEFCAAKTLGDHLDGVKDPYKIKSEFLKNTDWHTNLMFSVTYEFGERCATCHYID